MLRQDIRSLPYRGRGEGGNGAASQEPSQLVREKEKPSANSDDQSIPLYECRLDVFTVKFRTLLDYIYVESVTYDS